MEASGEERRDLILYLFIILLPFALKCCLQSVILILSYYDKKQDPENEASSNQRDRIRVIQTETELRSGDLIQSGDMATTRSSECTITAQSRRELPRDSGETREEQDSKTFSDSSTESSKCSERNSNKEPIIGFSESSPIHES